MRNNRQINTTIPADLHREAVLKGIKWNDALIFGIKHLANVNSDEEKILDEIKEHETIIKMLKEKLEKVREEKKKKEEANKPKYYTNPHDMYKDN